jgi:lysophospholipase L1-like esterase
MKFRQLIFCAAALVVGLLPSFVSAASYISYTGGAATRGEAANNGNLNIGREFTVTGTGIDIQDLGFWDYQNNGLASAHTVTLFSLNKLGTGATATPISGGSVIVPAGISATLDNGFRFKPFANPLHLAPGNYAAVAYGMNSNDPYGDGGNIPAGVPGVIHGGFDSFQFTTNVSPAFPTGGDGNNHSCVSFHFASNDLPPKPASGLKIMPLGDSITDGVGGSNAGYRGPLNTLLNSAGIEHVFVGSATDAAGSLPYDQQHHEGHSGFTITGGGRSGILDNINSWLGSSGADPDVILLMIGTNDVTTYATSLATVPQATANLNKLISTISNKSTGLKPNAKLIIAGITPIVGTVNGGSDAVAQAYNQSIATLVASHQALGENVSLVDMHSALNASTDMNDQLHPNDKGYNKMAAVWLNGITAVVPEPSSIMLLTVFSSLALCLLARSKRKK